MSSGSTARRWLPAAKPVLAGFTVWIVLAAGATLAFDVAPVFPVLFGFVAGVYAWTRAAYPATRRLHFRTLDGRDRWLAAAFVLVAASQFALVAALDLGDGRWILTFLTIIGSILTTATLGALVGERGGLEETDWP